MNSAPELESLKARHTELYDSVFALQREGLLDSNSGELEKLNRSLDELLEQLQSVSTEGISAKDYDWLNEALMRWQILSTSVLKQPRRIEVPPPPKLAVLEDAPALTAEQVEQWLRAKALHQSRLRRAQHLVEELEDLMLQQDPVPEEHEKDWHIATIHLGYEVICGRMPFQRLTAASFKHLENAWLDEVKVLWAYFRWRCRGAPVWAETSEDLYAACDEIRERMFGGRDPGAPQGFEEAKLYIEGEYLTAGRIVAPYTDHALHQISSKAFRLSTLRPQPDTEEERKKAAERDWATAEAYVRDFYEAIIPAVTQVPASQDSRGRVVSALRQEPLVNAFEAALAVYFLPG